MTSWRPSASLAALKQAAQLRTAVRQWMSAEAVLEVSTPALSGAAVSDPHVISLATSDHRYLHTSPEFPMKRLLAAYACDIYQIAQVYRAEECGRRHNTQFTMLEWYRVGMDHHGLIQDLEYLLASVWQQLCLPWPGLQHRFYGEEVLSRLGVWPEQASTALIQAYFDKHQRSYPIAIGDDLDAALALFVDEFVLPDFAAQCFTILMDYPASQPALARVAKDHHDRDVAQRFELYYGTLELANGFHELSDADSQARRFAEDQKRRAQLQLEPVPIDQHLLDALAAGLPDCAGIAVGLERLHMVIGQHEHIEQVLSFDDQRA